MELRIERYQSDLSEKWDKFVLTDSMNGTFLQTRRFIEYHPRDKFKDCSLIVYKGNEMVASILACEQEENHEKIFFSHRGTTFGGIVISEKIYSATNIDALMTPPIFCRQTTELLDYFLFQRDYQEYDELNYYLKLEKYQEDIMGQFSSGKRRDCRYSVKNNLEFRKLGSREEIRDFYRVLLLNLKKLGLTCVHQYEELIGLKENRIQDDIEFYGVYKDGIMIAGSMVFLFDGEILHTQYLASDEQYLKYFPMDFLIYHLIKTAVERGFRTFTFGICTEDRGKYLNLGLSRFKEGFGTEYCINRTFFKKLAK
jgi:hypothetical protein